MLDEHELLVLLHRSVIVWTSMLRRELSARRASEDRDARKPVLQEGGMCSCTELQPAPSWTSRRSQPACTETRRLQTTAVMPRCSTCSRVCLVGALSLHGCSRASCRSTQLQNKLFRTASGSVCTANSLPADAVEVFNTAAESCVRIPKAIHNIRISNVHRQHEFHCVP